MSGPLPLHVLCENLSYATNNHGPPPHCEFVNLSFESESVKGMGSRHESMTPYQPSPVPVVRSDEATTDKNFVFLVSTPDFESGDLGSNPGGTSFSVISSL
nr:unnamed protein product [Digitaria exilis]